MSNATLTSLAMLKVRVDHRGDYLDYLLPFVRQVLHHHKPESVTDVDCQRLILNDFGLDIPVGTVQLVLKRLARANEIERSSGVYRVRPGLEDPRLEDQRAAAARRIAEVVLGLMRFSRKLATPIESRADAEEALCAFLADFDIPCLRAYVRGTAIPSILDRDDSALVLVSRYVLHLQEQDPQGLESFAIMAQGHMLANALLCPDLVSAPRTFGGVTFYLDTPVLTRLLGIEGQWQADASRTLVRLLLDLGARVAAFEHTRDELDRVIGGAIDHLDADDARGPIVMEARRTGTTRSDLELILGRLDSELEAYQVETLPTPRYNPPFQIDESAFGDALDDEVRYYNPHAREEDINSVRSVYALRSGLRPRRLEDCGAALISSNAGFAKAAWAYGRLNEWSAEVSPVVTDFAVANLAWLKSPVPSPAVPRTQILAYSYAALQPGPILLSRYLVEVDRLERTGRISAADHQLLRSSPIARSHLVGLTLGVEAALTEETINEVLDRTAKEIKAKESAKLERERSEHDDTRRELARVTSTLDGAIRAARAHCEREASANAQKAYWLVVIFAALISVASLMSVQGPWWLRLPVCIAMGVYTLMSLVSFSTGIDAKAVRAEVKRRALGRCLAREQKRTGLSLLMQAPERCETADEPMDTDP